MMWPPSYAEWFDVDPDEWAAAVSEAVLNGGGTPEEAAQAATRAHAEITSPMREEPYWLIPQREGIPPLML